MGGNRFNEGAGTNTVAYFFKGEAKVAQTPLQHAPSEIGLPTIVLYELLNLLKNYIAQQGSIALEKLYDAPFTAVSHEGIDGVFTPADVSDLVTVLRPYLAPADKEEESAS